jgi:hypothetical protein
VTIEIQHEHDGYVCVVNGDVKARGRTIEEAYRFAWTFVRLSSEPVKIWLPPLSTTWY